MSYWQQPLFIGLVFKTVLVNWRHYFVTEEAGKWKYCTSHGKTTCGLTKWTLVKQKKTRHDRR